VTSDRRLVSDGLPLSVSVRTGHDLGAVTRLAGVAAETQGFDQTDVERVRVVAAGMATNLAAHTTSGRVFVRVVQCGDLGGVELVATDHGPGMPVADAPGGSDGGSVHTNAQGLGAIASVCDLFDVYGAPGRGTVMMARLFGGTPAVSCESPFLVGSMREPIAGEEVCGDGWAVEQSGSRLVALVADGLGHGVDAAAASTAAVTAFRQRYRAPVEDIVAHIHGALRSSRGAALAVAEIDSEVGRLRFCGIGNIAARLLVASADNSLISQFGIAGYQSPKIRAYDHRWEEGAVLVMHSDGLSSSWDLRGYGGLLGHHPQLAAATVMRDAVRANDDAMVLALRDAHEAASGATMVAIR
jgi:anti-sigma regulatory factor (Ser/Thr protein kinase)/serine/threonine protein phosphatase PrpC